jgi:DNA-binding CsgD family transcriptional regulator
LNELNKLVRSNGSCSWCLNPDLRWQALSTTKTDRSHKEKYSHTGAQGKPAAKGGIIMTKGPTLAAHPNAAMDVVGELHLNSSNYLIINLENGNDWLQADVVATDEASAYVEILRFEVSGQLCAIVQLEESSPENRQGELTEILTERELQIATLVAMGRLNKQIADKLHISEWTVSTHLRRIFAKLGVRSRAAMVYRCAPLIGVIRNAGIVNVGLTEQREVL